MKRFLSMLALAVLVLQSVVTSAVYAVNEEGEGTVPEAAVETVASDPVSDEGNDNDVVTDLTNSEVTTTEVEETTTAVESEENTVELETPVFEEFDIEPLQLGLNLAPRLFAATEPEQSDFEKFVEEWNTAKSCDDVNDEAGCVYNPRQYGLEGVKPGSGLDEGQVGMWKLVQPTDNPGEYKISIAVKGKDKVTTGEVENKVCAVVVIDRSHSMTQNNRWEKAKNGAIAFSKSLRDKNTKAYIGLVVFSNNAEPRRRIEPKILEEGDFGYTLYGTNIHDGLIKAKDMFDDDKNDIDCVDAKKYIVLLGDGEPNRYMTGENPVPTICDTATCGVETIKYANELKTKKKIEIFSIGYETNSTGNNILQGIASTEKDTDEIKHFYTGDTSSVATAFDNIATSVINIANAGTDARVSDNLGASVSIPGSDARTESYEIGDITEEGHVYTFTVRIDPSISGNQATNDGVTLTYTGVDGNHATLDINNSASVNWILPECGGTHPEGNVSLGSGNFTQSWVNDRLTPGTKDWKYKTLGEGESLGACEWTCDTANGYVQNGNTCELQKFDITPTVTNGTINPTEKFSVEYGYDTEVSYTHNTGYALKSVTVDGEEVDRDTYKESYTFEKVTKPHTIKVVYAEDNNGNGIPDDEEGTYTVVYTDGVDNEEVFATETYTGLLVNAATPSFEGSTERSGYVFSGWNPEVAEKVTGDATYTAKWGEDKNGDGIDDSTQDHFTVRYTDGVEGEEVFADKEFTGVLVDTATPAFGEEPTRSGYVFSGWNPEVAEKVTGDATYTAQWKDDKNNNGIDDSTELVAITFKAGDHGNINGETGYTTEKNLLPGYDNFPVAPNVTADNGWQFNGWNPSYKAGDSIPSSGYELVYTAQRKQKSGGGGGSSSSSYSCKNLPDNAVANNSSKPTNKDTDYSYSTGTDEVCTFQCKAGYTYNSEKNTCVKSGGGNGGGDEVIELGGEVSDKCSVEGTNRSEEEKAAYLYACENDITTIRDINEARLGDFLTRAEMAKMISVFATKELGMKPNTSKDCSNFANSIANYNQEMKDYMVMSCQLEIMGIHTTNYEAIPDFMPNKHVSRAEFGTVLSRILWGNKNEGTNSNYYVNHLNALKENNIITNIDPTITEYRAWVFLMLYRSVEAIKLAKATTAEETVEEQVNEELKSETGSTVEVESGTAIEAETGSTVTGDTTTTTGDIAKETEVVTGDTVETGSTND